MSKGPLKLTEKYTVIGMHFLGASLEEIKEAVGRSEKSSSVELFLESFLKTFEEEQKTRFFRELVDSSREEPAPKRKETQAYTETKKALKEYNVNYDHQAVLSKMSQAGIHGEDALRLIEKALQKFKGRSAEVSEIYNEAMRNVGVRELMIRQGVSGEKGVAVMTEGASTRGESVIEKVRAHQPDYVFHVQSPNRKK